VWWWIAYAVADLTVYVGIFRWFYDFVYRAMDVTWAKRVLIAGVWARAFLLLLLFAVFLYSRVAHGVRGRLPGTLAGVPSHPVATFGKVGEHVSAKS
jgi:hypothetical protein